MSRNSDLGLGIVARNDGRLDDIIVPMKAAFNLTQLNSIPSPLDHAIAPTNEFQISRTVLDHEIAGS